MTDMTAITAPELESEGNYIKVGKGWILASMTDSRGVITYANSSFSRVSGYALKDLIGAPHRIVRNPNMPKAVFQVYWERLQDGRPVCAYIDNKAKNGKFYYVCALAMPYGDGYVSVRLPAEGPLARQTQDLYAEVLRREKDGLSPSEAADVLRRAVRNLGYASLDAFMHDLLDTEFDNRNAALGLETPTRVTILREMLQLSEAALDLVASMREGFQNIRGEPVNMRILSSRLENTGAAISTISQNYEQMASEMSEEIAKLATGEPISLNGIRDALREAGFNAIAADLMNEAAGQTRKLADESGEGREDGDIDHEASIHALATHVETMMDANAAAYRRIVDFSERIPELCRVLRRRINGLDVVKLLCRVENGRIGKLDAGLSGIIDRLERFHGETDRKLSELSDCAQKLATKARTLQ